MLKTLVAVCCCSALVVACSPASSVITDGQAIDGDTFVSVNVHYRLIWDSSTYPDAPELPGHCRVGRQCAPGDPFRAKRFLQAALDNGVTCQSFGLDRYGRTLVDCLDSSGRDIGTALMASGNAQACRRLSHRTVCYG